MLPNDDLTALPQIFVRGGRAKASSKDLQMVWDAMRLNPRASVIEFTRDFLTPGTPQHRQFEAATTKKDRQILSALVLLQRAHSVESPSSRDMQDAAALLLDWRPPQWAISPTGRKNGAGFWYRSLLTEGMKGARLVMTRGERGSVPAVLCPDLKTAAFVFAAYRGVKVCGGCRKLFAPAPERDDTTYCSETCGQRIWQRQYRQREKEKRESRKVPGHKAGRRK